MRTEATDPYCLPATDAAELLGGAPWTRLVAIGDSVAEGVRAPATGYLDLSWVDRIARALRPANPDLTYRNLGEPTCSRPRFGSGSSRPHWRSPPTWPSSPAAATTCSGPPSTPTE
jgi:hypothetical protein